MEAASTLSGTNNRFEVSGVTTGASFFKAETYCVAVLGKDTRLFTARPVRLTHLQADCLVHCASRGADLSNVVGLPVDPNPPTSSMWKFDTGSGRESVPVQWRSEVQIRHIESAKVLKLEKAGGASEQFHAVLVDADETLTEGEGTFQLLPHYEQELEDVCFENNFWIYSAKYGAYLHMGALTALDGQIRPKAPQVCRTFPHTAMLEPTEVVATRALPSGGHLWSFSHVAT